MSPNFFAAFENVVPDFLLSSALVDSINGGRLDGDMVRTNRLLVSVTQN